MSSIYLILAFMAGIILPIQIGINSSLARLLNSSVSAITISFAVGFLALLVYLIISHFLFAKANWLAMTTFRALPLWTLTGGILGAAYVATTISCAPQIGSTLLVVLVVSGQMIISLLLDHYGLVGFPIRTINLWRVLGVGFLLSGVIMIMKH